MYVPICVLVSVCVYVYLLHLFILQLTYILSYSQIVYNLWIDRYHVIMKINSMYQVNILKR